MPKKNDVVMFIDVETTGLSAEKNDLIQMGIIVEVDNAKAEVVEFKCQPFRYDTVQQQALDVHGISIEEIRTFPEPTAIVRDFISLLEKYTEKGNKITFAGYNCPFDERFVKAFLTKCGYSDTLYDTFFVYKSYDIFALVKAFFKERGITLINNKLATVCEFLDVDLNAHDAVSDIEATYLLAKKFEGYFASNSEPEREPTEDELAELEARMEEGEEEDGELGVDI